MQFEDDLRDRVRDSVKAASTAATLENARLLITNVWQGLPSDSPFRAVLGRVRDSVSLRELCVVATKVLAFLDDQPDPYPSLSLDSYDFNEDDFVLPSELPSNADRQKRALNNLLRAARGDSVEPIDDEDVTRSDSYQARMEKARANYKRRGKGVQRSDASDSRDRGRPMPMSGSTSTIGHSYY